jgi:hypothetical protein
MIHAELTCPSPAATNPGMRTNDHGKPACQPSRSPGRPVWAALVALALSGCISVNAPDKPIVIELNMNITMDVVYKLSGDATKTVDTNKDIF